MAISGFYHSFSSSDLAHQWLGMPPNFHAVESENFRICARREAEKTVLFPDHVGNNEFLKSAFFFAQNMHAVDLECP